MAELAILGGPRAVADGRTCDVRRTTRWRSVDGRDLSGLAGQGPIEALEQVFAFRLEQSHCLALSSGTAALHTALLASGVGPSDDVLIPAYDWSAAATATLAVGARPVFVDVDRRTYVVTAEAIRAAVTPRTKAAVVTHLLGNVADIRAIRRLLDPAVVVIEDCAQALGASSDGHHAGSLGDIAAFSFGPGKAVSAGEGGLLATRSQEVFEAALQLTQHPLRQIRDGVKPNYFSLNYRMHPIAAEIALEGLSQLDTRVRHQRQVAEALADTLKSHATLEPPHVEEGVLHAFHRFSPSFESDAWDGLPRSMVVDALAAEGVPIHHHLVRQTVPRRLDGRDAGWPVSAERCAERELVVALPDVDDACGWDLAIGDAIEKVYSKRSRLRALIKNGGCDA